MSHFDDIENAENTLHEGVSDGLFEVADDNPGNTKYKLTGYGSVRAKQTIAEKGLPFLVAIDAIHEVEKGNNPTVREMSDKLIKKFPAELRRLAKKNFAPFWGEFGNWSAEEYLEEYRKAQND